LDVDATEGLAVFAGEEGQLKVYAELDTQRPKLMVRHVSSPFVSAVGNLICPLCLARSRGPFWRCKYGAFLSFGESRFEWRSLLSPLPSIVRPLSQLSLSQAQMWH